MGTGRRRRADPALGAEPVDDNGQPFIITGIRAGRAKPGLLRNI